MLNCASTIASVAIESRSGASSSDEAGFVLGLGRDRTARSSGIAVALTSFRRKRPAEQELLLLKNKEEAVS
jgi:hypothetical protein